MGVGFVQISQFILTEICLSVKNKLFVVSPLEAFEAKQIFVAVEVACKPYSGSEPVILEKVEYPETGKKVYPRIVISRTPVKNLVGVVKKGEVDLVCNVIVVE